ncbi:MAG: hypothetical protein IPM29_16915 [Planctomycetes bacterium]|nr:hypothetical protein [Planctomycetota bacterium]
MIGSANGVAEIGDQPTTPRPSPFGHVGLSLPLTNAVAGGFFSAQMLGFDSGASAAIPIVFTNAIRATIP